MAREFGIGVVSARRSTHFGMAASYALPAVEAGLMAMVFSNASPAMPPWGGKQMLLGTNPFCMAAPGRQAPADHPRHVAGGRGARKNPPRRAPRRENPARLCARRRRAARPPIPRPRWPAAWCCRSASTRAPGISMFMDIFGGVISGANFGGDVGDQYKAFDRAAGRRPLLPGDEAQPVRHRGRLPRPHRHADRSHEVRAARRRLRRGAGAGRAGGPRRSSGGAPAPAWMARAIPGSAATRCPTRKKVAWTFSSARVRSRGVKV